MDVDRPHHFRTSSIGSSSSSTNPAATTSELFVCFASRLSSSSSSMKLSKSILSPGRGSARDSGPVSLSSSLSRRLRTNGSLKGGQASPFFSTSGKKRGCGFENAEPSSPKVTCIGQVRVKTKKKVKQTRSLSKRRGGGGVSFRKIEQGGGGEDKICNQQKFSNGSCAHVLQQQQSQECLTHRNQRWVHLPVSICEGLRSLGADFSCLFPCKSSCFSSGDQREKADDQKQDGSGENGCGAVFTRWLVSVNDGEGGKRREIELVVGGGDEEELRPDRVSMRSSRRHVFEDIEVKDDRIEVRGKGLEGEEEAGRVSICIPPKNALLLMRCRSDPMKMAALGNRFSWDSQAAPKVDEEEDEDEDEDERNGGDDEQKAMELEVSEKEHGVEDKDEEFKVKKDEVGEDFETEIENVPEVITEILAGADGKVEEEDQQRGLLIIRIQEMEEEKEQQLETSAAGEEEEEEEEIESNMSSFEDLLDQENGEHYENYTVQPEEEGKEDMEKSPSRHLITSTVELCEEEELSLHGEAVEEEEENEGGPEEESEIVEKSTTFSEKEDENPLENEKISQPEKTHEEDEKAPPAMDQELISRHENKKEKEIPVLPDCLLLMMCEPKLSMEVSKETWVCSADFVRWLPERPLKPIKPAKGGVCDHAPPPIKRRLSTDSKPKPAAHRERNDQHLQEPRRSSCSLPPTSAAAVSMAAIIEQKLVNAVAYEPLVLTRCKSEPMRTASAKLMPDSRLWKNAMKKLEPHRPATLGAAGLGF